MVELGHLLPSTEDRAEIEAVLAVLGDNPLRPVWEELEGRHSYDDIRLVRLARRLAGQAEAGLRPAAIEPDPRSMMRQ